MDGWIEGWMDGWLEGWIDRWMNDCVGWMTGQQDGWMDGESAGVLLENSGRLRNWTISSSRLLCCSVCSPLLLSHGSRVRLCAIP